MNFIKIKDDYINLDNVIDIVVLDHDVTFTFTGPHNDSWICYHDDRGDNNYQVRKLATEELEELTGRIRTIFAI